MMAKSKRKRKNNQQQDEAINTVSGASSDESEERQRKTRGRDEENVRDEVPVLGSVGPHFLVVEGEDLRMLPFLKANKALHEYASGIVGVSRFANGALLVESPDRETSLKILRLFTVGRHYYNPFGFKCR